MGAFVAPLALLFERIFGYPPELYRAVGHPVTWIGALIAWLERLLNNPTDESDIRRNGGVAMIGTVILAVLLSTLLVQQVTRGLSWGWLIEALLAGSLLAQKELGRAVSAVAVALDSSLEDGRDAVSHIVGRDTAELGESGVARAAIESLAESTSDAVVAPLFWLIAFGLPGIALYKAINTADSMVGHLDRRYRSFGWASAKLDDLVNWVPARLTALLIAGAAFFVPGADPERAWKAALRDARKHRSPNAGWPEAAMAGAMGISLGGPRAYRGEVADLPRLGEGDDELGPGHVRHALMVYEVTLNLAFLASLAVALLMWRLMS